MQHLGTGRRKLLCGVAFATLAIGILGPWIYNSSTGSFPNYFRFSGFSQSFYDPCLNAVVLRNEHEAAGIAKRYLFEKNKRTQIPIMTLKDSRFFVEDDSGPMRWELALQLIYSKRNDAGDRYSMWRTTVFVTVDNCGRVLREGKSSVAQ
jgi:hypothetical protein